MRLVLASLLFLAGCTSQAERDAQIQAENARLAAADDKVCRSYGAKPGTEIYVKCRMDRASTRDSAMAAIIAAQEGKPDAPIGPIYKPVQVQVPPLGGGTRCASRRMGDTVYTDCN